MAKWAYISDVFASPRDSNTVFVALNNWQRGDYAPYIVKSTDRGRTFTNITGNLPAKRDLWGIIQDHINGDLLFAGTEFGAFTSVDGGKNWIMLKGNMPLAQVRDIQVQKSYSDLVLGTFGRGIWILDDYSALRGMTAQTVAEEARLYPTRDTALLYNIVGESQQSEPMYPAPNPELGAMMTYTVGKEIGADAKLVINITDNTGRQVRRMEVPKDLGLHRAIWNLRTDVGVTQPGGPGSSSRQTVQRTMTMIRIRPCRHRRPDVRVEPALVHRKVAAALVLVRPARRRAVDAAARALAVQPSRRAATRRRWLNRLVKRSRLTARACRSQLRHSSDRGGRSYEG